MKKWRHKILPVLLAGSLSLPLAGVAAAKDNDKGQNNGKGKSQSQVQTQLKNQGKTQGKASPIQVNVQNYYIFTDLQQHWAEDIIKQMVEKQIIKGYADRTFQPNKPVTQIEAITMVMNLLNQEKALLNEGNIYIGKDIPNWAVDNVKLALINDIVSLEDLKQPNKPATRLFIIKLLVNALGADLGQVDKNNLFFGDVANLTSEQKAYLSFAIMQSLVTGYEDKTFKPNKPVTRAEMAIFVKRLFDKVGDVDFDFGYDVKGTIDGLDKDDEELTIGSKTYELADDAVVKIDGKTSTFDSLDVDMKVEIVLKDNKIQTVYAYTIDNETELTYKVDTITNGKAATGFEEAVVTGESVDAADIPDLSGKTLEVSLNGKAYVSIDLDDIGGREENGDEIANDLEVAFDEALGTNRVNVSFDNNDRFVFKTNNSPTDVAPSIQFSGTALDELGLDTSITRGSLDDNAVAEKVKLIIQSDAASDETYVVEIEDGDIDEQVEISIDDNDEAEDIAEKIADALSSNSDIRSAYEIDVDDAEITLTSKNSGNLEVDITITEK